MPAAHILSYTRDLGSGGVERALVRLAGDWAAAGRRVTLVLGAPTHGQVPPGVEVIAAASLARKLPRSVRECRPDLIFCPGNHYTSLALWTRLRLGHACPPLVAKLSNAVRRGDHGPLADAGHRAWLRLHGRFLDHLVAMTPATADQAAAATGMAGRVSVIPNPPPLSVAGAPMPELPASRFVLGVGRLVAQKRWDRLIAAMPTLGVPLVILGEGPLRAALAAQARALGVDLRLPGHVVDPLPAMAAAAVLALTSDFEGVPGVLREALSVGTPVVATDAGPAIAEIVAGPALGTIVGRDDAAALERALCHWLADAVRPTPVPMPGTDAARRYLMLFDRLVDASARR